MARASKLATESTLIFLHPAAASDNGIESVTTNSKRSDEIIRLDRRTRQHSMRGTGPHTFRSLAQQRFHAFDKRACRIHQVVHHQAVLAVDVANDVHHFGYVGIGPALIDDRQRRIQPLSERSGTLHTTRIGETTINSPRSKRFSKYSTITGAENKWSTGISKKPCI